MNRPVRSRLLAVCALLLVGALTVFKVPLASSQGLTLLAAYTAEQLPASAPDSPLWQTTTAIQIPLSAQQITAPQLASARIQSVTSRALHDGSQLALMLEWSDDTEDASSVGAQDFPDAAAVQFPLVEGPPFFCMGQPGGDVNIWHWKADRQADLAARQDMQTRFPNMHVDYYPFTDPGLGALAGAADYNDTNYLPALASGNLLASLTLGSPVEDLVAGGFGTLTSQPAQGQNVGGFGEWSGGRWRVIFVRDLASTEAQDVVFRAAQVYPAAFALWDGSNGERDGQKSTSQWISLQLEAGVTAPPAAAQPTSTTASREPYIFVLAPMAAVMALLVLGAAGLFVVASLQARRK